MLSPLQKIKRLIPYLPVKDIPYAIKFYDSKDWESLRELTWSSLTMVEEANKKVPIPSQYEGIDIDKVRDLAVICSEYYDLIFPEELEEIVDYDVFGDEEDF